MSVVRTSQQGREPTLKPICKTGNQTASLRASQKEKVQDLHRLPSSTPFMTFRTFNHTLLPAVCNFVLQFQHDINGQTSEAGVLAAAMYRIEDIILSFYSQD